MVATQRGKKPWMAPRSGGYSAVVPKPPKRRFRSKKTEVPVTPQDDPIPPLGPGCVATGPRAAGNSASDLAD